MKFAPLAIGELIYQDSDPPLYGSYYVYYIAN